MDNLKQKFEAKEKAHKEQFEYFFEKNKDNQYMTNLLLLKFRLYHYKEFLKLFISNNSDPKFEKSKRSLYCMLAGPSLTLLIFQIFSPFSIFRKIGINGMIFGTIGCFTMSIVDELDTIARKEKG